MRDKFKHINRYLVNQSVNEFSNEINDGENILDVGAGSGHYRCLFKNKQYVAIDMGLEQSTIQGLDVVGDICFLPFKNSSFKNVICIEVLEHVWDSKKLLQELNRVLENGGKLLLTVPLCFGEHMQPYDFYRYTSFSLVKLLEMNGFKLMEITPRGGYYTLLGYLTANLPDQMYKVDGVLPILRKILKIFLRIAFTYILAPVLISMDRFDKKKHFTLGYICKVQKVFS
jgi:SAM-dependent methyltransferase